MSDSNDWLPSQAQYLRERGVREASHGIIWSTVFPTVACRKLRFIYDDFFEELGQEDVGRRISEEAFSILQQNARTYPSSKTLWDALYSDSLDGLDIADWFASIPMAISRLLTLDDTLPAGATAPASGAKLVSFPEMFYEKVNDVLLEERIGWLYVDGRFRERRVQPLHVELVMPVEALLSGDVIFRRAEVAYQEAMTALAQGYYGSAVSLSYSAVQETFLALGAQGGNLGALFANAKTRGFLRGVDANLLTAIKALDSWLTANRSERGNAHGASDADRDDAQLSIHVAASLMVRLMKLGAHRASTTDPD